jgi:hypothetical protein
LACAPTAGAATSTSAITACGHALIASSRGVRRPIAED